FIVMGASGDLAKKKIYPTLWSIYLQKKFPPNTSFVGFARSKMNKQQLLDKIHPFLKVSDAQKGEYANFAALNSYISAEAYNEIPGYKDLDDELSKIA
ncbi:hypothetical protein, partial [Salmonella sp. s51228]|uniref:hypothetical protein n=1 Tax=Salmonella sp. s51228 TaxID=3159652 RepID=UPI003981521D